MFVVMAVGASEAEILGQRLVDPEIWKEARAVALRG